MKYSKKTIPSLLRRFKKKKKKLNPSNYFISKATFQTIFVSSNSSLVDSILSFENALENRVWDTRFPSVFLNGKIESVGLELLEMKIVCNVA